MSKLLKLRRIGDPVLRKIAKELTDVEIASMTIQTLIADIRYTNKVKRYGVGLAAPQVGKSVALSVIGIKPTPTRPDLELFDSVIINPTYKGLGDTKGMWEGCQSCGSGDDILYAQAARYETVTASWHDEMAQLHEEQLSGFVAHVFQHETDHLKGILFVDKIIDTRSMMMADEYRKRIIKRN